MQAEQQQNNTERLRCWFSGSLALANFRLKLVQTKPIKLQDTLTCVKPTGYKTNISVGLPCDTHAEDALGSVALQVVAHLLKVMYPLYHSEAFCKLCCHCVFFLLFLAAIGFHLFLNNVKISEQTFETEVVCHVYLWQHIIQT